MRHPNHTETRIERSVPLDEPPQSAVGGITRPLRLALITAGQSPRPQILADLVDALPDGFEIQEFGALDALSESEIDGLNPAVGVLSVATRLRDGRQVIVPRSASHTGIQTFLSGLRPGQFDLVAIFCTGAFDAFPAFHSPCRLIQSQPAMDNAVNMLVHSGHKVCVIQPNARHMDEDVLGLAIYQRQVTWLDTSKEADWVRVVSTAKGCEALVLNSFDYDEGSAVRLRRETGMPVLLPRRVLASAIRLVFDVNQPPSAPPVSKNAIAPLLERLTPRERQILWLMVEGLQSKQIAYQLEISLHTVSIHRANVLSKLGMPNTNVLTRQMLGHPTSEPAR